MGLFNKKPKYTRLEGGVTPQVPQGLPPVIQPLQPVVTQPLPPIQPVVVQPPQPNTNPFLEELIIWKQTLEGYLAELNQRIERLI